VSEMRVTYRKSAIGYAHDQKATIAALGLRRLHQTVEHPDTPALRGMVHKVRHLVSVDGVAADSPAGMALLSAAEPAGRVSSGSAAIPDSEVPAVAAPRRRASTSHTGGRNEAS